MHKKNLRFLSLALAIGLMVLSILPTPVEAAALTKSEINTQIKTTYKKVLKLFRRSSLDGYCGAYVSGQLQLMGINTNLIGGDGKDQYDTFKNMKMTSGGYRVRPYPASVYSLQDALNHITDNGTQNAYTVTVRKGTYTFYNITPGVGGEFYVRKGSKIVQKGHLRPTGTLRMIYSDTPGLQNMRDLGGWPCDGGTVKYNLLIRGGMVIDAADRDRNTWVKLLGIDHDVFVKTYADGQLSGKDEYRTKSPLGDHITLYQMDLSAEGSENKRNFADAKAQMPSPPYCRR